MNLVIARSVLLVRQLVLAAFVGSVLGLGAYLVSSTGASQMYMGFCYPTVNSGFDPWTGLPHGATLTCVPEESDAGNGVVVTRPGGILSEPIPPEIVDRRAIPLPFGFVVGAGLVLILPTVNRLRRSDRGATQPVV